MSEEKSEKTPRDRSPSFPFVSLKNAIARLEDFENKFGRQEPPADRAYLAWNMKGDTSQSAQTLAALKSFGLVDYKGAGTKRLVSISEDARKYLRAQQDHIKQQVLKSAALKPKWISYFWGIWGADKVPDEIRLDTLVLENKFAENGAPKFLRVYDETIAFAELASADKFINFNTVGTEEDDTELSLIEIGDLVQAEVNGVLFFEHPRRIRAITEHDGERWAFVEKSETGIPVRQLEVIEKGQGVHSLPPKIPVEKEFDALPPIGTRREVITLDEGDVTIVFPDNLSANSFEDLKDHLDVFIKKMKRRSGVQ